MRVAHDALHHTQHSVTVCMQHMRHRQEESAKALLNTNFRFPIKLNIYSKTPAGCNQRMVWTVHKALTCCDRGCHADTLLLVLAIPGRASPHQAYTVAQSLRA